MSRNQFTGGRFYDDEPQGSSFSSGRDSGYRQGDYSRPDRHDRPYHYYDTDPEYSRGYNTHGRQGYQEPPEGYRDSGYGDSYRYGRSGREQEDMYYQERVRSKARSLNFEKYAEEGNRFVNEVAAELGTRNRDRAARILRSVLHALRDRLPSDKAVMFAQGLPMAIKGVYFDRYDISRTPVVIRRKDEFLDYIISKDRLTASGDFPEPWDVVMGLRAVFRVLEKNMSRGQVDSIKNLLHTEILEMITEFDEPLIL